MAKLIPCKAAAGGEEKKRNKIENSGPDAKSHFHYPHTKSHNAKRSQSSSSPLNTRSNNRIESQRKWNGKINSGLCLMRCGENHCYDYYHFHKPSIEGIRMENANAMGPQFSFKWTDLKLLAAAVSWPMNTNHQIKSNESEEKRNTHTHNYY